MKLRRPFGGPLDMKNSREHENQNHGTKSGALTTSSKNAANVARNKTATVNLEPPQPLEQDDRYNYALLIALYTLQGIPLGLSASIPFLAVVLWLELVGRWFVWRVRILRL